MELLELFLHSFVNLAMLLFEYIGVGIITFAGIQGLVNYIRRTPDTRLILAKGLAMGLEFKLGSEILRTVIVRNMEEIYIVAWIIILRAVLTFLIHWEIKTEEQAAHAEAAAAMEKGHTLSNAAEKILGQVTVFGTPGTAAPADSESDAAKMQETIASETHATKE